MKTFIDTNVLVYWVDDSARADAVEQLLAGESVISVQVLNEFANVLRKKRAMPVADIQTLSNTLISACEVHDLSLIHILRGLRAPWPADFSFDREEANAR